MTMVKRRSRSPSATPSGQAALHDKALLSRPRRALSTRILTLLQQGSTCRCHGEPWQQAANPEHRSGRCCPKCLERCSRSSSSLRYSIVLGMVNAGIDESEAWVLLMAPTNYGGAALQELCRKNQTRARKLLAQEYAKATEQIRLNPPFDEYERIVRIAVIRDEVLGRPDLFSPSRAGNTERQAAQVLIDAALKRHSFLVSVGVRFIAESVDCSRSAANNAMRRLCNRGDFVIYDGVRARGRSQTYRLKLPEARTTKTGSLAPPVPAELTVLVVPARVHRLFGPEGVGLACLPTFSLLPEREAPRLLLAARDGSPKGGRRRSAGADAEVSAGVDGRRPQYTYTEQWQTQWRKQQMSQASPVSAPPAAERCIPAAPFRAAVTAKELAAELGRPAATVRRHLNRMASWRMAARDEHGCWWRLRFDPEELADSRFVAHTGELRARVHLAERRLYWQRRLERGHVGAHRDDGVDVYYDIRTGEVVWTDWTDDEQRQHDYA